MKPGVTEELAIHWRQRDRCCAAFTDMNTQFGMLSHSRGLFYIILGCVGIVINVQLWTDVHRLRKQLEFYGLDQTFPMTAFVLQNFGHFALINIITEAVVTPVVIHWNFTFWWDWSEEICIWFQTIRQLVNLLYSITITFIGLRGEEAVSFL